MQSASRIWRCFWLWLALALLYGAAARSGATPAMDGARDADYVLVAASPPDNLLPNDAADPRFRSLDATNLWAANTASDLFLFIELPYLDLNTIAGEWAVAFHLGGANDALQRSGAVRDPYDASVDLRYTPGPNAILKSNMRGFRADYDGNQGWAFLNSVNKAMNDWAWNNSNFLGEAWTHDAARGVIHGVGAGEVVYKSGAGIEVRFPLALFAANPGGSNVSTPVNGDDIRMQFYANVRERGTPRYPRGPVDCVPFEAASRTNPARGTLTQWATYRISAFSLTGAGLVDPTDTGRLAVTFSAPVGNGAEDATHYTVEDTATSVAVPVSAASVDPSNPARVLLSVALPFNARLRVTAQGVRAADGTPLSGGGHSALVRVGSGLVFHLYDPHGAMAALGNDPATGRPYRIVATGGMIGWRTDPTGASEIPMEPVPGEPGHWRGGPVIVAPGVALYRYRVPALPDADDDNALNPRPRQFLVPATTALAHTADNAAGAFQGVQRPAGPLTATFTLVDLDNVAAGRGVSLAGDFNGWNPGPGAAVALTPVAPGSTTYRATFTLPNGYAEDTTTRYKYVLRAADGTVLWNDLNPHGDRWALFHGTDGTARITDILGGEYLVRILRAAGGLDAAPHASAYTADMDPNRDGRVTLLDAAHVLRTAATLPRLRAEGTRIVDERGRVVNLRGVNLGGLFVEEMWMTPWVQDPPQGSGYARVEDHVSLWNTLQARLGVTATRRVMAAYRAAWMQSLDYRRIHAAGFDHVRLPFLYSLIEEPGGMETLAAAVREANRAGLHVILDMHGAPGGQNAWDHSGQVNRNEFFGVEANIAHTEQVWADIARAFGAIPGVAALDLLNEPANALDADTLARVHDRLYRAIRAAAPDTMIIVEDGYKGFSSLPPTSRFGWTNVVYSTHLYNFDATSSQDHLNRLNSQLPGLLAARDSFNVPLYVGEFNLEPHNSAAAMAAYTQAMTNAGVSWTLWTYKTVARGGPMGYWGAVSNPSSVTGLNPFTDSEAALLGKMRLVRTENLATPAGLEGLFIAP